MFTVAEWEVSKYYLKLYDRMGGLKNWVVLENATETFPVPGALNE
jgi:hypothetical protein